ncbi:MAG: D-aminoacyl-tRNA deacylase [Planctomycetota bacterium]
MRVVLQRVSQASVQVDGRIVGEIQRGLLALVGIAQGDDDSVVQKIADKTAGLRIFPDASGKMNLDVQQAGGAILAVSQFTLLADCRKGRRPAFTGAAAPEIAKELYEAFVAKLRDRGLDVATGIFAADMDVRLVNSGPVTIVLDEAKST